MTGKPAAILYIDDDEGLRRLTRRALERRGHQVTVAANGDEGVALAAAAIGSGEAFDRAARHRGELAGVAADGGDVLPGVREQRRQFAADALRPADDDRVLARHAAPWVRVRRVAV